MSVSAGAVRNLRKKGGGSRSEMSPSNYLQNGGGGGGNGRNWIEHEVSRFDTLAGVAIKYGVEVQLLVYIYFFFGYSIRDLEVPYCKFVHFCGVCDFSFPNMQYVNS